MLQSLNGHSATAKVLKKNETLSEESQNINYFCIVKRITPYYRYVCIVLFALLTATGRAMQTSSVNTPEYTISLLTCAPGKQVWSLYGHTALRIKRADGSMDVAVNWGMFDTTRPHFVPRFVLGLCDYTMGVMPMDVFLSEYRAEGRQVTEQQLNLTPHETKRIVEAVSKLAALEDWTYRYNFLFDNCTTRARDMIYDHLDGRIVNAVKAADKVTWRDAIHQYAAVNPWAKEGNDLLLGVKTDVATTAKEREFLPDTLMQHFNRVQVSRNGQLSPLVTSVTTLLPDVTVVQQADSIYGMPTVVWLCVVVVIIGLTMWEYRHKRVFWQLDAVIMACSGVPGLLLLVMMFSQHPFVQLNLQILVFNPLALIFLLPVCRDLRRQRLHLWFYRIVPAFCMLFWLGFLLQDYAFSALAMSLILFVRCCKPLQTASGKPRKATAQ